MADLQFTDAFMQGGRKKLCQASVMPCPGLAQYLKFQLRLPGAGHGDYLVAWDKLPWGQMGGEAVGKGPWQAVHLGGKHCRQFRPMLSQEGVNVTV